MLDESTQDPCRYDGLAMTLLADAARLPREP